MINFLNDEDPWRRHKNLPPVVPVPANNATSSFEALTFLNMISRASLLNIDVCIPVVLSITMRESRTNNFIVSSRPAATNYLRRVCVLAYKGNTSSRI
jgi:hypothetical protein